MIEVIPYEQRLNRDRRWALMEGSMHFEKESSVFQSMKAIARRLAEHQIPYAVAGGMALFQHGYRRFTEDVDILVTPEGLRLIHQKLEGLGYLPPFEGSKNLRDTETGVRIEFLVSGGYPGDGQPKPVAFPDPSVVRVNIDGVECLRLNTLVELKLTSGTAAWRRKDLGDVQEMIRVLALPRNLGEELHPFVRDTYQQLWDEVHSDPQTFS